MSIEDIFRYQYMKPRREGDQADLEEQWERGRASLITDGSGTRYVGRQVMRLPVGSGRED